MPDWIAFFGMIAILIGLTKGAWLLMTAPVPMPKRVRAWCVSCDTELVWTEIEPGVSTYDHPEPAGHEALVTTTDPNLDV